MSSTPQRTRSTPTTSSQLTGWIKTFPAKVETQAQSMQFIKKMLAVTVSNIAYLRSMFPEEAFVRKSLDKLPLRIIKERNSCKDAGTVASWLVSAFDAIERKYLRQLILFVYLDQENPDDAHEVYTFRLVLGIAHVGLDQS